MALLEEVMVLDILERVDKALIEGCRPCGGWGINISDPYCVVVT